MGWNHDPDAIHSHKSGEIHALPEKSTPVDADLVVIEDSEDSWAKKKVALSSIGTGGGGSANASYSEKVGDASTTTFEVEHSLDSSAVAVEVIEVSSGDGLVAGTDYTWSVVSDDKIEVVFDTAPGTDDALVVVLASGGTSEGGGGGSLTPDEISDLAGWWDADAITGLSDNDPVSSWTDLSGNGNHFVQATAANQPTYQTNEVNGKPVVAFDWTNDGMTGGPTLANPFSIFYVARAASSGGNRRAIQGASNNWLLGPYSNLWQWYSGGFATNLGGVTAAQVVVHGAVQTSSLGHHFLRQPSGLFPAGSAFAYQQRATPGAIGAMALGAAGAFAEPFNGDFCEIVAYSRALTYDEGLGLLTYLADKWGIT